MFKGFFVKHVNCRICGKIAHMDEVEEAGHRGDCSGNWYKYYVHPDCAKNNGQFKSVIKKLPRRWVQEKKD